MHLKEESLRLVKFNSVSEPERTSLIILLQILDSPSTVIKQTSPKKSLAIS